jgi:N-acetylmuramoyl-L-alanine amidase
MLSNRRSSVPKNFFSKLLLIGWLYSLAFSQEASPPATPPQTTPATTPTPLTPVTPTTPVIMIDAAHGGTETGAVLAPDNLEKDVTLSFARRLRQDLLSRGFQAQLVRDGDMLISTDQRATIANAARPALYICVHITSQGTGLRIYSAILSASNNNRGPFVDWGTAQTSSITRSRSLQQQLTETIQKTRFPLKSSAAPLRPLNNITVPALALEIAPANGQVSQLASPDYQNMVSAVVANAVSTIRDRLESGR